MIKLDLQGKKLWERTLIESGYGSGADITPTNDGGYAVICSFNESNAGFDKSEASKGITDFWMVKLDADGSIQWEKTIGGSDYDNPSSILQTKDGGYLLGGNSSSPLRADRTSPIKGEVDYWIVKLSSTGVKQWDMTYGGPGNDLLKSMAHSADGGYLLGGDSSSPVGKDKSEFKGEDDYWIVKIDSKGNKLWDKNYGGTAGETFGEIFPSADGGYFLRGTSYSSRGLDKSDDSKGGMDVWILKINSVGQKQWDKAFGGPGNDFFGSLDPTPAGDFLISVTSNSAKGADKSEDNHPGAELNYDRDYWLLKVSSTFSKIWDKTIGGGGNDFLVFSAETPKKQYFLAGTSTSGYDFQEPYDRTVPTKGGEDIWIVGAKESTAPAVTRINAGGPDFTTATKKLFIADKYYAGIDRISSIASGDILNTSNDVFYRSGRCSPSFSYNIPVANGNFDVILHFAEIYYDAPVKRAEKAAGNSMSTWKAAAS